MKGWSLNSQLSSVPSCQSIIKRAAVKRMEQHYHQSWFAETGAVHRIQFSIRKNIVTIFLDSSGAGLHKRGYRQTSLLAPMKETLAAGIVDFTRLYDDSVICDPFCRYRHAVDRSRVERNEYRPWHQPPVRRRKMGLCTSFCMEKGTQGGIGIDQTGCQDQGIRL